MKNTFFVIISFIFVVLCQPNQEEEHKLYQNYYRRQPPPGYNDWINFASRHNCSTKPIFYDVIEKTLNYFRSFKNPNAKTISPKQIKLALKHSDVVKIKRGSNGLILPKEFEWMSFLNEFVHHFPQNYIMVMNIENWPVVAPVYSFSDYEKMYPNVIDNGIPDIDLNGRAYNSIADVFEENKCFQVKHNYTRHGFASFMMNSQFELVTPQLIPIFSHTSLACYADLLIPANDHFYHASLKDKSNQQRLPWKQRKDAVVWRGVSSGNTIEWMKGSPYMNGQRQRLVKYIQTLQKTNSTEGIIFNVAFSNYVGCPPEICKEMREIFGPPNYMDKNTQYTFKYIIDVDGNGRTESFLPTLSEGSLILKAKFTKEFFHSYVRPNVHYLGISPDYSNLLSQIKWARDNDESAYQITIAAKNLADNHLRVDDLKCYLSRFCLEYASLLKPNEDDDDEEEEEHI